MSERMTITLDTPIEFGKQTITELSVRPGRFGDLKGLRLGDPKGYPFEDIITVAARMCGQPSGVIEKLGEGDVGKVMVLVMGFLALCLGTGTVDSPSSE